MSTPEDRLRAAIRRLRKTPPSPTNHTPKPTNPFEVQVDARLASIEKDLDRLRSRLDWLLTVIVGASLLNVLALLK